MELWYKIKPKEYEFIFEDNESELGAEIVWVKAKIDTKNNALKYEVLLDRKPEEYGLQDMEKITIYAPHIERKIYEIANLYKRKILLEEKIQGEVATLIHLLIDWLRPKKRFKASEDGGQK